ncbi:unnamed protein product [Boreogadus saida]
MIARASLVRPSTAAIAVVPGWTRLGRPSPVAKMTVGFQSGQDKGRVRKPRTLELELQQCRQLGLVQDCSAPIWQKLVGAPMEVVPDHTSGLLETVGDGRPNQGGGQLRNGATPGTGRGAGAGPLNNRDYVLGVGVGGRSDP